MLQGKTKIELFETRTGGGYFKVEDSNMVTNAIANLANPPSIVRYFSGEALMNVPYCITPLLDTCFSSLLLFQENLVEDANNFIPNLSKCHNLGYAVDAYSGDNPMRGTLNTAETKNLSNGKRYVWDFGTDKANGTIRSVGLSNYHRGFHGLRRKTADLRQIENYSRVSVIASYMAANKLFTFDSPYNYSVRTCPVLVTSSPGFAPVGNYVENEILFYKTTSGSKTAVFEKVKLEFSRLTLTEKTSLSKTQIQKTTDCELSTTFVADENYLYSFYAVADNKVAFVKIDIRTFEIIKDEYITVQDMNLIGTGPKKAAEYKGYYYILVPKSKIDTNIMVGLYKINIEDLSDYTYITIKDLLSIPINESTAYYEYWEFMLLGDSLYLVNGYEYTASNPTGENCVGQYAFAIDETTLSTQPILWRNATSYGSNYGYPYKIIPSTTFPDPYCLAVSTNIRIGDTSGTNNVGFGINTMFLSTINNLSTPVVKNETQTMKVTYEITEI